MTHVYNDPAAFKDDILRGFAAAYPQYVDRVEGASGFQRAGGPLEGKVSLVIGGGSGHYPSYSGVTGVGFADAGVLGDLFASPSAEQVYRVAKAAHGGAGVVLSFGNYAGDRLNFAVAQERLQAEGIDTRIVYVTDDIASASADERGKRRGIAGTFTVYKMGGAAAEDSASLDEVERIMHKANDATCSFGVAFAGCTMPGADEPLFVVPDGQIEFGLGIHGEPGISSSPTMSADDLAAQLVERVLAERPADADGRAAVLLNGLGATKYEELFVLFGRVAQLLADAGVTMVMPEVGELVTSLDMAGCSLTVTWLDDELERYWVAPADTPAFRRGTAAGSSKFTTRRTVAADERTAAQEQASPESVAAAQVARDAVVALNRVVEEHKERLGRIDAIAGDGDHGIGMSRGSTAAAAAATETQGGVQTVLAAAGAAFGDKAGGTSGILWGMLLAGVGTALGNTEAVTPQRVAAAVQQSATDLQAFSKAELGDKTMLDALFPFVDELVAEVGKGRSLAQAWATAAAASVAAGEATASLVPKIGRARPLAERSVGTPDPGAISMGLIVTAVGEVLATADCG
ncbi:dihydroxyacetone kinase family protein [Nakamurella leprariae]|uniref:Dihydroxyacetone kinase family protein n=1 Tax=Nakamurella leprariae TaxID=2803911 RepID=A0A939C3E7_9ACTN|nr:dihydroxyacetone kinase family protein [Nakamurella leprariae]MBM9469344.1 dihydroxyacetone kinase family protein [Nakamurella leprariae]